MPYPVVQIIEVIFLPMLIKQQADTNAKREKHGID